MLVRLDAARHRLGSHHSAPYGSMRQRGGGFGAGGNGGALAAQQLLQSLFDGAFANGGMGPRRGGGGGARGGGRQAPGTRPREGEWCCICGFSTNRPYREACFACGRARHAAEVGETVGTKGYGGRGPAGGGAQKGGGPFAAGGGDRGERGPFGAGGTRPLLGGRGKELQGAPTFGGYGKGGSYLPSGVGKGPQLSATGGKAVDRAWAGKDGDCDKGKGSNKASGDDRGQATTATGKVGWKGSWARPPTIVDDEGYQLVQPRRVRDKGDQKGGDPAASQGNGGGVSVATVRRRWSDDDGSDDDALLDEGFGGGGDVGGVGDDGGEEVDPRAMRAAFEEHARAVRDMERKGTYGPALDTLRAARDEAEKRWRDNKPPAPLAKRLDWAEAKVRKSQAALTKARLELDAFDEETDRRRAELCRRIEEAQGWYDWRRQQLDGVHAEAAGRAPGRLPEEAGGRRTSELQRRIRSHTLPEIHSILEEVQEGSALHERLALVVASLADAEAKDQQNEQGPAQYNLGDDDSLYDEWGEDDQEDRGGHDDGDACMDECGGHGGGDKPAGWKPEGPGRWSRKGGQREDGQRSPPSATTEARGGDGPRDLAAADGKPSASGSGGLEADGDGERAGKHRRRNSDADAEQEERRASDARRAQELQRQLECATAAQVQSFQSGKGGFGSEAALCAAAQKFVLDVQRAQAQAGELGIEARAEDGRTLLELSPAELSRWSEVHLKEYD